MAEAVEELFSGVRDAMMIQERTLFETTVRMRTSFDSFVSRTSPTREFFNSLGYFRPYCSPQIHSRSTTTSRHYWRCVMSI